jgi:hypothetical protein
MRVANWSDQPRSGNLEELQHYASWAVAEIYWRLQVSCLSGLNYCCPTQIIQALSLLGPRGVAMESRAVETARLWPSIIKARYVSMRRLLNAHHIVYQRLHIRLTPAADAHWDAHRNGSKVSLPCATVEYFTLVANSLLPRLYKGGPIALWIHGLSGSGKSTVTRLLCQELEARGRLLGSFCASRFDGLCGFVRAIIPTLAYQLGRRHPMFAAPIIQMLEDMPDILTRTAMEQIDKLLVFPLERTTIQGCDPLVFVVDGLDELQEDGQLGLSVDDVVENLVALGARLSIKILFTHSLPFPHGLAQNVVSCIHTIALDDLHLTEGIRRAVSLASGLMIVEMSQLLGVISVLRESVPVSTLRSFVDRNISDPILSTALQHLSSIITIRRVSSFDHAFTLYPASMSDYLQDPGRCYDVRFVVNSSGMHARMALRCLQIINEELSVSTEQVALAIMGSHSLVYACRHWCFHTCEVAHEADALLAELHILVNGHLDSWIMALSILHIDSEALDGLQALHNWLGQGARVGIKRYDLALTLLF